MAHVTLPATLTNGTIASATDVINDLAAIVAEVNGDLDATNIAASLLDRIVNRAALKTRYTAATDAGPNADIYSLTGTFHGGPVLVTHFGGEAGNNFSAITQPNQYQIYLDGAQQETIGNGTVGNGTRARLRDVSLLLTGVAAGSHTISVRNSISDGSGAYTTNGNNYPILFAAVEL